MMKNIFKALSFVVLAFYWAVFAHADTITYFHNDLSGSPMVATDVSGNLLWKQEYSPYGARSTVDAAATATNNLWFAGKPQEPSYGISYMGARYYHPLLGRFLSVDPMEANPEDIHGLNRYSYANNNPAKYVDSDGHSPIDVAFFAYDIGKLGYAIYRGEGVKGAALDVAMSAVGVVTPVPFAGQAMKAARIAERGAEAGHVAALATKVESAAAREASVVANGSRGRASEARVLNDLGLTKNTKAVSTAEGRSVPDAMTEALSVEIKDVASVSRTRQIRIQTEAARNSGRESVLITGELTCVSGPCAAAFDRIIRRPDLGPK
jgi:RHS repeat-associated protein